VNRGYPSLRVSVALARRELRGGLRGFRIFLACLALGVAAIASVQSVSSSILQGLRDDGQAILGGDISLRRLYRGLEQDELAYLGQSTENFIHFVEMRTMGRRLAGEQSTLIELKGVGEGYPLFGQMELEDGLAFSGILGRTAGVWGAVVESAVLEKLGVGLGDRILVGDSNYEIRAVIKREPDRVGGGGRFGLGPRVMVSLDSMSDTGLLKTGSLIYYHYRLRLPPGVDLDAYQENLDKAFPNANWRVRDYRNASPTLKRMVNRLTLFLTLVGLTALLVGGVGVSNAVKSYLDTKLNTIAMLKCVGGPNRTIFQIYMLQILILAAGVLWSVWCSVPWCPASRPWFCRRCCRLTCHSRRIRGRLPFPPCSACWSPWRFPYGPWQGCTMCPPAPFSGIRYPATGNGRPPHTW